ncbi:putative elongator complex protein [Rosa chinensis]|uniref:Elongator complex protein 4 n=1 Tax=Rosa chinensis TaxID=74649 RepID=A0A2P6RPU4_ROSCH|nr:putative elongator complex protein [Rosa chinensis]
MAATKTRRSSFSRSFSGASSPQIPGLKHGPNGTMFVSSGIPDLDKILGGNVINKNFRSDSNISCVGRIAIQSFCAPQCGYSSLEWDMLSFLRSLKSMLRSSNAVVVVTFPPSLLSSSSSIRWQHMADTLLSVKAIPDEDKELATLLTGYQDMVGLLNVQKVAQINTQVVQKFASPKSNTD